MSNCTRQRYPIHQYMKGTVPISPGQRIFNFWHLFKQHFDTRYLVFYNPSPPRMFLSLELLSEYRIQHGAIGLIYVTSSYWTWIFCRGVSGFATDCPCDVWCRGLTTCLPACWSTFWKSIFKQQLGCGFDILNSISSFFFVFWHMQLYMSWYIIYFGSIFTS